MSRAGDVYDYDAPRRHASHHHRHRDEREPRYVETEETYVRSGAPAPYAPDAPYTTRTTELVRRPARTDSDLSIEEVRRDFPPPNAAGAYVTSRSARDDRYGPPVRSRSAERHYGSHLGADSRRSHNDDDRRSRTTSVYEEKKIERRRSLSRNQKILAAVGGAALAVGGKELWDRRQASSNARPVSRNALSTAALGAAGAFAAYEGAEFYSKRTNKVDKVKTYTAHRGRDGEVHEHYSSEEEKPKKSRRKSIVEGALGLAGLSGAAAALKGEKSRGGSPDSGHSKRSRSRGGDKKAPEGVAKYQQAAKAALLAGATEAFRVRKEPGGWGGAKGKRILTAAIGAGGIDAAADRNPDVHSKRHILEAVVGGLAGNRLINGSRKGVEGEDRRSRSRARSRARSQSRGSDAGGHGGGGAGLAALATAGLGALAGKKYLDNKREKSQERSQSRSRRRRSRDSYDSRSPSPERRRSKSVSDYAKKGLAALGVGGAAHEAGHGRDVVEEETTVHRRHRDDDRSRRHRRRSSDDYDDDYYDDRRDRNHGSSRGDVYGDPRHADSRDGGGRHSSRRGGKDSETDLGSSSEDEKRIKKMKGKQFLTMGLATVATIHAAHNVYQSMEKREARHKAVKEGEISPEEAKKLKRKAILQDTASIGIAALGIKGAISEIKEANEMRRECREFRDKKEERHKKRLERMQKSIGGGSDYRRSERDGDGYTDWNPYGRNALPAPSSYYGGR